MSIAQALASANSGLGAVSRQASVASQNIANALTPGYSRREVSLAERTLAGAGAGVRVAGIVRAEAPAVTRERRAADAAAARDGALLGAIERISRLIGGPEDANALFGKFAGFDRTLRELANAPDNAAAQDAAVGAAKRLVSGVNALANSLQTIRAEADGEIAARVGALNQDLKRIERLNDEISRATVSGRDASSLLDERDLALNRVNESLPVRPLVRENGKIDLMTEEGVLLISGAAREVRFAATPIITADMSIGVGSLSGLVVDGVDITPGFARGSTSGAIAGLFSVRDDVAPSAAADFDALAEGLIARFETAGLDPTLAPGSPGLFTDAGAALAPPPAPGLAARLQLNAAVDPSAGGAPWRLRDGLGAATQGPSGSNAQLRAFIAVMDEPRISSLAGGKSVTALEAAGSLGGGAGAKLAAAEAAHQASADYASLLNDAALAVTGVDTDAELQNLLLIEQAYAANAKIIEAVNQMIARLMEI